MELSPRQEFMCTDGFALYTDVNRQHLRDLLAIPPIVGFPNLDNYERKIVSANPGGASLFLAKQQLVPAKLGNREEFFAQYGVTEADLQRVDDPSLGLFASGFGALDFPWHFSAILANDVTDFFIDEGKLLQEQKNNFTLYDWATMINSPWFKSLVHQMALTGNGLYEVAGQVLTDFDHDRLINILQRTTVNGNKLLGPTQPLFTYTEDHDHITGSVTPQATLSNPAAAGLQTYIKSEDSIGCPVARHSIRVPRMLTETNPHFQNLIDAGLLRVVPERSDERNVRLIQDQSAIDRTLEVFAWQLHTYVDHYGTPYVVRAREGNNRWDLVHR